MAKLTEMAKQAIARSFDSQTFPSLGDERKRYTVELSEPEINAIHAAFGFMLSGCEYAGFKNYWKHYGPTVQRLSERLEAFDDGNAPFQDEKRNK